MAENTSVAENVQKKANLKNILFVPEVRKGLVATSVGAHGEALGENGTPLLGPHGEILSQSGIPLVGPHGELLGADGQALKGPNGELIGPHGEFLDENGAPILGPHGELMGINGPILGSHGELLAKNGATLVGLHGEILGANGEPLKGPNGELIGQRGELMSENGQPVLGSHGELMGASGPLIGPRGEILGQNGEPVLGPHGELLGADGQALKGPNGELIGQRGEFLDQNGAPILGPHGELLGVGGPVLGPHGEILGPSGAPLVGPHGEVLSQNGEPLKGPNGELIGQRGELMDAKGKPMLGQHGELLGANGAPLLGSHGELLGPDGQALSGPHGELLSANGEPLKGPNGELIGRQGELLDADGKPVLGKNGELLGVDGQALQGPDGVALYPSETVDLQDLKKKQPPPERFKEAEKIYQQGLASVRDLISPSSLEVHYDHLKLSGVYVRSFFVYAYPRYLETNWLSPIVNFDATVDMAQFIYPISSADIMRVLRRKVAQIQSSITMAREKGNVRDPTLETALEDAEQLRTDLQRGQEKFFQMGFYFTVYAEDEKKLETVTKQLESMLGGRLVLTKRADIQGEHAFNSTLPICVDEIELQRNMNTSPLSTTFPFISANLAMDEGILYGLNRHNNSLIIFDRFKLPNANSCVFATSGAGKSYAVKLEILRQLMLGTDVIVIDPENEYEALSETVGGTYLRVSLTSDQRINPFDLPKPFEGQNIKPGDLLRENIITLTGLMKLMLGEMTATEEALVDKALIDTYAVRGITMDVEDPSHLPVPTMEDFESVLSSMKGAESLAQRLQKYTTGTFGGIFNKPTNVDLGTGLVVFCIRDLEEILRPVAMFIILNYIWNRVRSELKKRLMVIDEAWTMMQHKDAARFLYGLVKRARKYYLGVTTITQDVEDFLGSPYGRPVVTNASMQILMKQAPSSIEILQKTFNLTDGEKYMLLNSAVGQGLFFADNKHAAIQVIASYSESQIVTTNPEELLARKQAEEREFSKAESKIETHEDKNNV